MALAFAALLLLSVAQGIALLRIHQLGVEVKRLTKDVDLLRLRTTMGERWIEALMNDRGYRPRNKDDGNQQEDHGADRRQRGDGEGHSRSPSV